HAGRGEQLGEGAQPVPPVRGGARRGGGRRRRGAGRCGGVRGSGSGGLGSGGLGSGGVAAGGGARRGGGLGGAQDLRRARRPLRGVGVGRGGVRCGGVWGVGHVLPVAAARGPDEVSETSSSAPRISFGRVRSSLSSMAASCAAVRAPTIGAATPSRSRTHASATARGERPRPSAAVTTDSTMRPHSSSR